MSKTYRHCNMHTISSKVIRVAWCVCLVPPPPPPQENCRPARQMVAGPALLALLRPRLTAHGLSGLSEAIARGSSRIVGAATGQGTAAGIGSCLSKSVVAHIVQPASAFCCGRSSATAARACRTCPAGHMRARHVALAAPPHSLHDHMVFLTITCQWPGHASIFVH